MLFICFKPDGKLPRPHPTEQVRHLGRCAGPAWFCVWTAEGSGPLALGAVSTSTWEQRRLGVNSTRFPPPPQFQQSKSLSHLPGCFLSYRPARKAAPWPSSEGPPWGLRPDWPGEGGRAGMTLLGPPFLFS